MFVLGDGVVVELDEFEIFPVREVPLLLVVFEVALVVFRFLLAP